MGGDDRAAEREVMVERQLRAHGIDDEAVLAAFRSVPRHLFVPDGRQANAYDDGPLGIACDQTISQPRMVAIMTVALDVQPGCSVLEIGVGSGYQTSILLELSARVTGVERHPQLAREAEQRLRRLGYGGFRIHTGDGTVGRPGCDPFDRILVAAAAPSVPRSLLEQLAPGGRLVVPVGDRRVQELVCCKKRPDGNISETRLGAVVFVPLVGEEGFPTP